MVRIEERIGKVKKKSTSKQLIAWIDRQLRSNGRLLVKPQLYRLLYSARQSLRTKILTTMLIRTVENMPKH